MKDWGFFEKYEEAANKRMPDIGEGETMASQIATATSKLIYKYYNDGDVYDNTGALEGWWNDLSSYANWLHKYAKGAARILEGIGGCYTGSDYEDLLADLAENVLGEEYLQAYDSQPKQGSIYKCAGPFRYEEPEEDEEEDDWEEEEDEEWA